MYTLPNGLNGLPEYPQPTFNWKLRLHKSVYNVSFMSRFICNRYFEKSVICNCNLVPIKCSFWKRIILLIAFNLSFFEKMKRNVKMNIYDSDGIFHL